ncbi:MAG: type III pantothenate kinase, partial [Bacteroidota bacterium]
GLVNEVLNRMIEEMGGDVFLVATGGLSAILKPVHERFDHIDRRLTLEGLRMISEKFSKPTH